jgi:hypothetical protein
VYWRAQLAGAAAQAEVQFHPVHVRPPRGLAGLAGPATHAAAEPIEICLGAACVVRVPRGVAAGDLRAVITAVWTARDDAASA